MNWTETPDSSNIARYRYDEKGHVLTVEFKNGGTYNYYDVPLPVYVQIPVFIAVVLFNIWRGR